MEETIRNLIGILLTKDSFVNKTYLSFTFNYNNKINEFDCVKFKQDSANNVLEMINDQKIKSFNLTIKEVEGIKKDFNFKKGWHSSSFVFHGSKPGTTKVFFECRSSLVGFSYDSSNNLIPQKNIPIEKISNYIDILIEMNLTFKNTRKSILHSIKNLKKI